VEPLFVDCHSHVVPSGDDGAKSPADGLELCDLAAASGTAILFATPHVWPHLTLTEAREREIRGAYERLKARARLELRLGYELTPAPPLLHEDPARYLLEGSDVVLVEMPFPGPLRPGRARRAHRAGWAAATRRPSRAHRADPPAAGARARAGAALAAAGERTSLLGRHGEEIEELAWGLVEAGDAAVVASDGHRLSRPPRLDEAYELVRARVGEDAALPLFDGSALGLRRSLATPTIEATTAFPTGPSHAPSRVH
jgi:protein-tyrosine phosphatase